MEAHLTTLLYALIAVFCVGTILPELLRKSEHPIVQMISHYFNGPYHLMQVAGFSALISAFSLIAHFTLSGLSAVLAYVIAGLLTVVMTSDTWAAIYGKDHQKFHLTAAKAVFFVAAFLEFWIGFHRHSPLLIALASGYIVGTGIYAYLEPKETPWQEKIAVAWITAYWVAFIYIA